MCEVCIWCSYVHFVGVEISQPSCGELSGGMVVLSNFTKY
jgi:hypothetical protein